MDDKRRNPIDFWSVVKAEGQFWLSVYKTLLAQYKLQFLPDHFQTSLVYFTCKLLLMSGGTLSILGHGVKDQGQLRHSVYKTLWA